MQKVNTKGVFQLTVCFYHVTHVFQNESREVYPEWVWVPVAVFQCLYEPLILIDSIYRKDEYYYPKVFLEKYDFIEDM